jgi:hypothetical protein
VSAPCFGMRRRLLEHLAHWSLVVMDPMRGASQALDAVEVGTSWWSGSASSSPSREQVVPDDQGGAETGRSWASACSGEVRTQDREELIIAVAALAGTTPRRSDRSAPGCRPGGRRAARSGTSASGRRGRCSQGSSGRSKKKKDQDLRSWPGWCNPCERFRGWAAFRIASRSTTSGGASRWPRRRFRPVVTDQQRRGHRVRG